MPINASANTKSDRVPLTANRGIAVFSIGVMGFITANLIPLMIVALVEDLGVTESAAGAILTASLLVCAVTCLATTRIASGPHRHLLGRISLIAMAAAFGVAAIAPSTVIACAAIIIGGVGAGGAASVGGAALAALTNPDRVSSISGLVNRVVVTAVLALIPILGTHMTNAFGIVAVLALATAATVTWLPSSPVKESSVNEPPEKDESASATTTLPAGVSAKRLTFAGTAFLAMLAVWAISEDSLWAVLGIMGSEHAGLSDQQMGLALSASTAGGVLAAVVLTALGSRVSRTVSISALLILGAILKLSACLATDSTIYLILVIAWNTTYAATFIVLVAISAALDAAGRWSAPLLGTYLIGSAFAPLFGTSVTASLGYPTFGVIISGISFVLLVPFALVSRLSARTEGAYRHHSAAITTTVIA
ncbi:MFS transporter [Rhodococcus sp. IEGM 1409]|uniref:MFS transporter n=1 Tax=Rhodococcus sp. IEGM 1409 TaxID=3047082 RepID=UPI0024B68226|nr:MFS transporter [Rhodococcus sp. IEGM 1409]MDI9898966.1 MFS transporter [Rhodococcus sp. IEGM 1409]